MNLTPIQIQLIKDALQAAKEYLTARASEHNTHLGSILGAIAYQPIYDGLTSATLAFLAGNYQSAITLALPPLLGIFGISGAILTPLPSK